MPAEDAKAKGDGADKENFEDYVDLATFEQILEMDDDEEDREFSRSIVFDFFSQAESTFKNMDKSLDDRDLESLSSLGHFLKGSSATLGLTRLRDSCEKLQHFGAKLDETGTVDEPDENICLRRCGRTIEVAKMDYKNAERVLRRFYS